MPSAVGRGCQGAALFSVGTGLVEGLCSVLAPRRWPPEVLACPPMSEQSPGSSSSVFPQPGMSHLLAASVSAQWCWLGNVFMECFSPSICDKYSFKPGLAFGPGSQLASLRGACSNRHGCSCCRATLLGAQTTTFMAPTMTLVPVHTHRVMVVTGAAFLCQSYFHPYLGNNNPECTSLLAGAAARG